MGIRKAETRDAATLAAIYAPYVEHTAYSYEYEAPDAAEFARRLESLSVQFPYLVWEEDGRILGYAYASQTFARKAYGFLADLSVYVSDTARGKGIGRQLYVTLEEILRRQGYCRLYAVVTSANEGSCRFHEALGYRKLTVFQKSGQKFGKWYSTVWYEKVLRDPEGALPFPVSWRELDLSDLLTGSESSRRT